MASEKVPDIQRSIARCRVVLSAVAMAAVSVDLTHPALFDPELVEGGLFSLRDYTLLLMGSHLLYALGIYHLLVRRSVSRQGMKALTMWVDVFFGAAIASFTEGVSSPFYAFFAFAVVTAGFQAGFRHAMVVTSVSVFLYLGLILISTSVPASFYMMRPVHLAIVGYLVAYLGREHLNLEARLRQFEAVRERNRIARELHDGCVQSLAGINLRLESCRELLRRGLGAMLNDELAQLQSSVNWEHDRLRSYMRSLAGVESTPAPEWRDAATRFTVSVDFSGSGDFVDHVLQILREGATNVRRHAAARHAAIRVSGVGNGVVIKIDDDGVGFDSAQAQPWSIASRVSELGGVIDVTPRTPSGGHLAIAIPHP